MKLIKLSIITAVLASLSNAATITWTSAAVTLTGGAIDASNFATPSGYTVVSASNYGTSADESLNGITFVGTLAPSGAWGAYGSAFGGTTSLSDGGIVTGSTTAAPLTYTGLTIGNLYTIQALVVDTRGGYAGRYVTADGTAQSTYGNANGVILTGQFTADAATQDFTLAVFDANGTAQGSQINAAVLSTSIPEPTSALLGSLGVMALLRRRRA